VLDGDVARLAGAAGATTPGVLRARALSTRRTVVVTVSTDGRDGARAAVHDAVTRRLGLLADPPRVEVRAQGPQAGRTTPDPSGPPPEPHADQPGPATAPASMTTEVTR